MNQIFFDGLGNVTVIGSTVRLDFVTFSPTEMDANGRPKAVPSQRVIMSIEGFARATERMQETAQALAKLVQTSREQPQPQDAASPEPQQPSPSDTSIKPRLFP
jgi:hypothetical protein